MLIKVRHNRDPQSSWILDIKFSQRIQNTRQRRTDDPDSPASLKEDRRPSELSDLARSLARERGRVIALLNT